MGFRGQLMVTDAGLPLHILWLSAAMEHWLLLRGGVHCKLKSCALQRSISCGCVGAYIAS